MGEKVISGARLTRPLRAAVRQERFTMVRSINVFSSGMQAPRKNTRQTTQKAAPSAGGSASSSKKPAKTAEELAEVRKKNLRKANRALKKMRAAQK